jgi:hypothetical protein
MRVLRTVNEVLNYSRLVGKGVGAPSTPRELRFGGRPTSPRPPGTQFLGLFDSLIDIFKEPGISDVEVHFTALKLDDKGDRIVEGGQRVAQTRLIGIRAINDEMKDELRKAYEAAPLISLMVLWMRSAATGKKMGMLKFQPVPPGQPAPKEADYETWEKLAISDYVRRRIPN